MKPIARAGIDFSSTHTNGDTHTAQTQTIYNSGSGSSILINNYPAVVQDDLTECGDKVVGCSSTVLIDGKGVHRLGDEMDSHDGNYTPSICISASGNVFVG